MRPEHPIIGDRQLPETPWEALGELVRERVLIDGQTFLIERPVDSERLLNDPAIRAWFAADEYLPYWADLWPAARMLAKAIVAEKWTPGQDALELGCGLGLPGVAALSCGLHVIFADCDATALRFAAHNARLNGGASYRTIQLDWREPHNDLRVPIVLASDLVYELRHVEPIVRMIARILLPGGLCLLTDQDRVPAHAFREALEAAGLPYTTKRVRAGVPNGNRYQGTLYRIESTGSGTRHS